MAWGLKFREFGFRVWGLCDFWGRLGSGFLHGGIRLDHGTPNRLKVTYSTTR